MTSAHRPFFGIQIELLTATNSEGQVITRAAGPIMECKPAYKTTDAIPPRYVEVVSLPETSPVDPALRILTKESCRFWDNPDGSLKAIGALNSVGYLAVARPPPCPGGRYELSDLEGSTIVTVFNAENDAVAVASRNNRGVVMFTLIDE